MTYREHAPPPALACFVECMWTRSPGPGPEAIDVLPDGCLDVLVDRATGAAIVAGAMTRPHHVEAAHALDVVAVRFRPGGAHAFFGVPLDEWTDRDVPLADAWPDAARVVDAVTAAAGGERSVAALAAELARRVADLSHRAVRAVGLAAAVRTAAPGRSVAQLAADLGCTRQHLTRTFRAMVGLGPKQLQRIARMQRALALLRGRAGGTLAAVALAAGFADQAHLTHELSALTGATPAAWRRRGSAFHSDKTAAARGAKLGR